MNSQNGVASNISNNTISTSNTSTSNTISLNANAYTLSDSLSNYLSISSYSPYGDIDHLARNLVQNDEVSETTIRSIIVDMKNSGKLSNFDFDCMLTSRELSERFLDDFYNNFNKGYLYQYQKVSIDFIKHHLKDIKNDPEACKSISYFQPLTEEFIELFAKHIAWDGIAANKNIKFTVSFLLKYVDKFDELSLRALCKNEAINVGVFNAFLEQIPEDIRYKLDWETISWNKDLTEENILNNLDFIDFNSLLLATRKFKDDVITCFRKVKFGI